MARLKNKSQQKFRTLTKGSGKTKRKKRRMINPNCSKKASVSRLIGKMKKSNFEPSNGGMGIRLKTAKRIFQKIITTKRVKTIDPNDPAITKETALQLNETTLLRISSLTAEGMVIILAIMTATKANKIFDNGPAKPTRAGPHF